MEGAGGVPVRSRPSEPASDLHLHSSSTSTLAFDHQLPASPRGLLLLAEIVCGLLVWILVGGTDYFHEAALVWVMLVSVLYWVLTVCLFLIYLSQTHQRVPAVHWKTVSLCFNSSATVLYLVAAAVDAASVGKAIGGRHNYNCWAASAFFAFLTTLCYAGSAFLSFGAWRAQEEEL